MSVFEYTPKPWEPLWRSAIPQHEIERARAIVEAHGAEYHPPDEVWVNGEYQCFVGYMSEDGRDGPLSLSIKRNDKTPPQDWREKQAIKNEVAGPEREAVEIYPAESRLVDDADQAWLWVFPVGVSVPVGFGERRVGTPDGDATRRRTGKGSQRNWRPAISTGPDYKPGGKNEQ